MEDIFEEECMALEAIFTNKFTILEHRTIRIVVEPHESVEDTYKGWSFVFQASFPENYPEVLPQLDFSNVNNSSFSQKAKETIEKGILELCEQYMGEMMIYNIIEWIKDNLPEFIIQSKTKITEHKDLSSDEKDDNEINLKKEKMSKAQKRRYFNKFGAATEKPRGWNWIDIISHLSKVPPPLPSIKPTDQNK